MEFPNVHPLERRGTGTGDHHDGHGPGHEAARGNSGRANPGGGWWGKCSPTV